MRALVMRDGDLIVDEVDEPSLGADQLLVEPIAVGVCGSDLSAWEHTEDFLAAHGAAGMEGFEFDPKQGLVFGHEFTSRVLEVGPQGTDQAPGDVIVTLPHVIDAQGVSRCVGYSNAYPGALAERVVVQAGGHLTIPASVSPVLAAITEPLATGVNAVLRSAIVPSKCGAVVIGCGPIGLGAVLELAQRGIAPIVASDPSAKRREAASAMGAHHVVCPPDTDPLDVWNETAAHAQTLHVFEASGRPGMLDHLLHRVPPYTRVTVAGACMVEDTIRPVVAVSKNVTLDFITGPGRDEATYTALATTFEHLCRERFDPRHIVTGQTGLAGAPALFELLRPRQPSTIEHVKVLVRHDLDTAEIEPLDASV